MPEIAGINVADGLNRVAGNRRLYRDLLGQFAAKQGDAAAQISAALESRDFKLAERIAHTVKGVAGNLAITEVQSAAQKLEKAIREGQDVPVPLDGFAKYLAHSGSCHSASATRISASSTGRSTALAFQCRSGSAAIHSSGPYSMQAMGIPRRHFAVSRK